MIKKVVSHTFPHCSKVDQIIFISSSVSLLRMANIAMIAVFHTLSKVNKVD